MIVSNHLEKYETMAQFAIVATGNNEVLSTHRSWGAGFKKWGSRAFCVYVRVPSGQLWKTGEKRPQAKIIAQEKLERRRV